MDDIRALVSFCFAFYEYLGDQRPFVITFYADRCIELNAQQLHLLPQKHHGYQHAKSPVRSPAKLDRPQQAGQLCTCHLHMHTYTETCRHADTHRHAQTHYCWRDLLMLLYQDSLIPFLAPLIGGME